MPRAAYAGALYKSIENTNRQRLQNSIRRLALGATLAAILSRVDGLSPAAIEAQEVEDPRQKARIETTCALNPFVATRELNLVVRGGRASLTGTLDEGVSRDFALQIAPWFFGFDEIDKLTDVATAVVDVWIAAKAPSTLL